MAIAILLAAGAPTASADGLFGPAEPDRTPQPWFGSTVDRLYERARDNVLKPTVEATSRVLNDPAVQGWIEQTEAIARGIADKAVGKAIGLLPETVEEIAPKADPAPAKGAAEFRVPSTRPDAGLRMAALPAIPDRAGRGEFEDNDPFEPLNRMMFGINNALRRSVFDPASDLYHRRATPPVQSGVHNFFANLREPVTIASNLFEGSLAGAGNATARLGINTVLGVAGVLDPASDLGFPPRPRNLEQTLCAYSLPPGPYLVLPVLGPATLRDAVGRIAAAVAYFEVLGAGIYIPYRVTDIALQYSDVRERLRFVDTLSVDPYLAQRAAYLSTRTLSCGGQALADREFFTK
ncbi:MAG: VacJ family lipoprotein [Proteobacteria bacterium]|nr:VacJ family lipoprotein [Pseudomonadota bacterium]